jgi:signal peptidase I
MIWPIGAVALLVAAGWVLSRLRIAVVTGTSMAPTLREHDRVLVRRVGPPALRRGDVALLTLPVGSGTRWIIKRIAALPGDPAPAGLAGPRVPPGMLVLLGDNPQHSVDSRDFGYVPVERLFGVVVRKLTDRH